MPYKSPKGKKYLDYKAHFDEFEPEGSQLKSGNASVFKRPEAYGKNGCSHCYLHLTAHMSQLFKKDFIFDFCVMFSIFFHNIWFGLRYKGTFCYGPSWPTIEFKETFLQFQEKKYPSWPLRVEPFKEKVFGRSEL